MDPVNPVPSREDWLTSLAGCLREKGWSDVEVDLTEMSLSNRSVSGDQRLVFRSAVQDCEREIGPAPADAPMTAERAGGIYDQLLASRSCMEALGVSTSEPPSRSAFVDDYLSGRAPWSPYLDIPDDRWEEIIQACPQPG